MSFKIQKEGLHIVYEENDHKLHIYIDLRELVKEYDIKYMKNWEFPYEYEYIDKDKKREILKRVYEWFIKEGLDKDQIDFDFKTDANYKDIFQFLKDYAGITYNEDDHNITSEQYIRMLDKNIICQINSFNHLPENEKNHFNQLLLNDEEIKEETRKTIHYYDSRELWNYKVSRLLKDYSRRRIEECKKNPNQNPFNFGLYALDMILTDKNREEIKDILTEYVQVAKDKNLSFSHFISQDRPLNILLNSLL